MREQDDDRIRGESGRTGEGSATRAPFSGPPQWPRPEPLTRRPTKRPAATGGEPWKIALRGKLQNKRTRAIALGVLAVIAGLSCTLYAFAEMGRGHVALAGSAGPFAQQPTSTPLPTATATPAPTLAPLPSFSMPPFCSVPYGTPVAGPPPAGCVQCPYTYDPTSYSRAQIQDALDAAADQYKLPRGLVYAIAWGESSWRSGWITCNYDLGVMQLKLGYLETFDNFHEPTAWCPGVTRTTYDPIGSMQQNVMLGAKLLAWLRCYYGWMASGGGSQAAPSRDTLAWYYQQAGRALPDTSAAGSLCASTAQDPNKPWLKELGAEATDLWSCPFSATAGDRTFLDIVVAAYNAGPQALDGSIPNDWYVSYIEGIMTQFAQGRLPA